MIKKLAIDDLRPGMEVVQMSSSLWEHLPNLYTQPGPIKSEAHLKLMREQGYQHAFVEVEVPGEPLEKRLDAILADRMKDAPIKERVPFDKEIEVADRAYKSAMNHAHRLINDAKMGRKVDFEGTVETVDGIVNSAVRNPDTLLCLSKLAQYDDYTYGHCINVSAIAVVFGEFLGLSRDELTRLGVAGMMHDLGKTAVPERIINKRARLSSAEFEEIKRHPQYGYDILKRQGDVPEDVLEAVRDHHEKFNGKGYPANRHRSDTSALARIISLADVYDALTSDRSYKDAILPNKALAIMYGMRDQAFDPLEVQLFIKCLGIFPSGSLVKLSTGFYGVVYESNPNLPLMPKIKIILDQDLRPIPSELVDLAARQAVGDENLEILECADPTDYRINLKPYLTRTR
ncbi:HD-GYP domain-containing protein [Pseudodesulfovibrio sp. zrk46]|uniref:HD-GYP domain-containing protein n=1 Tax=Pseudodesulfovibrio sp. zrk46 TaxID=2725288 RepID=UPI0014496A28|nr:HD-GYP domain-containing protein [Pseudodesulfovibrio sp. zrk46]QJB55592.1 HD-GYP domain-containing protein [Pseudodesulfovibrio sp. zrk46]